MKLPRLLNTPLAATAGVLVGLSLLAIPLHQLTSAPPVQPRVNVEPPSSSTTPSWVTLKLLETASAVKLSTTDGDLLWSLDESEPGDYETQVGLPIQDGKLELILEVNFEDKQKETVAILTILPDGLPTQSNHTLVGSGHLLDLLEFNWDHE